MIEDININEIINIAKYAGKIIMDYYNQYDLNISYKADSSPITAADLDSNKFICTELTKLYPNIPIISEEDDTKRGYSDVFWSIDPLDATRSFINKEGEFTVNIGLIVDRIPRLGVVYSPLSKKLYYVDHNKIAYKQIDEQTPIPIKVRKILETGLVILVSSSSLNQKKLDQYLENKKIDTILSISSALKICMIAEGVADLYPRFGETMEWDTAAAHAILNAAGGCIKDLEGRDLIYGNHDKQYYNPEFIAFGQKN